MAETHPEFRVSLGERLAFLLDNHFPSRVAAAEVAGVNPDQLAKYVRGESKPPLEVAYRLTARAGLSLDWLAGASDDPESGALHRPISDDFVLIPIWDGEASSGHGAFPVAGEMRGALAFSRPWLVSIVRGPIEKLQVVFNRGRSNEPDIRDGDAMLVDCSIERLQADDYYVFDESGVLLVKMIERLPGGGVVLKARNVAEYEPRTLSRLDAEQLTIFGRVLWRGGAV
jgi:phage repressor protein C with HTH and peptisase S24 domain